MPMSREQTARAVLVVDAVGCAVTASLLVVAPSALRPIDRHLATRWRLVAALTTTAVLCAIGGARPRPDDLALTAAALANAGWVVVCVVALPRQRGLGARLVAATALLDAMAGGLQWSLRSDHA